MERKANAAEAKQRLVTMHIEIGERLKGPQHAHALKSCDAEKSSLPGGLILL